MRVPDAQSRAFELALCERLGLDAGSVSQIDADSDGKVTITAHLPSEEIVQMFNDAGRG